MTITMVTPNGSLDRNAPVVFAADEPVVSVAVELTPSVGPKVRETAFDGTDAANANGTFSDQYETSEKSGSMWTIRRSGGWPDGCGVSVRVKPATSVSGGISPKLPALQPTLYSPLAQWSLQGAPDTARLYLDRSGNSRHLTAGNSVAFPDLISGQTAIAPPTQTQANRLKCVGQAALAITGAMTVTCRLRRSGTSGCISVQSGIFGAGSTVNTLCSLVLTGDGSAPGYQWERTTGNMVSVTSPLSLPLNTWAFFSFRRASDGTPTFGVDAGYWTASGDVYTVPAGGSASFLTIGDNDEVGNGPFSGAIADYCIWNTRLTDSDLLPLRAAAMGI